MPTLRQSNSFSPGKYRGHLFDVDRLKRFVDGSNKALAAGVSIPLLMEHAPINASDEETLAFAQQPLRGAGWITKFGIDDEGELDWEAKDVPADIQKDVAAGAIKFTSPEFREAYKSEKEGVYEGPVIRHMAITHKPGNPHQGPIETIALQEASQCFQFGEDEFEPISTEQHSEGVHTEAEGYSVGSRVKVRTGTLKGSSGEVVSKDGNSYKIMVDGMGNEPHDIDYKDLMESESSQPNDNKKNVASQHAETPPKAGKFGKPENEEPDAPDEIIDAEVAPESASVNPDAPPKATDKSKLSAVIAGLAQKNVVLPSDWSPEVEGAMDILLGCLNSSIKAEQSADADKDDVEAEEQPVRDSSMPFSESELQFAETFTSAANIHNYKKLRSGDYKRYGSANSIFPYHSLHTFKDGSWQHFTATEKGISSATKGKGVDELKAHLAKTHASQHSEVETIQFTEEELAALTPKARQAIEAGVKALAASKKSEEEAQAKAVQFAEQAKETANNAAKYKAKVEIEGRRIPPSIKAKLLTDASLQFSEAAPQPLFTAQQVALMFEENLPPALQFTVEETKAAPFPVDAAGNRVAQFFEKGNVATGHVDAERAEELVASNPIFRQMSQPLASPSTIDEFVAKENQRIPNNVRRF